MIVRTHTRTHITRRPAKEPFVTCCDEKKKKEKKRRQEKKTRNRRNGSKKHATKIQRFDKRQDKAAALRPYIDRAKHQKQYILRIPWFVVKAKRGAEATPETTVS